MFYKIFSEKLPNNLYAAGLSSRSIKAQWLKEIPKNKGQKNKKPLLCNFGAAGKNFYGVRKFKQLKRALKRRKLVSIRPQKLQRAQQVSIFLVIFHFGEG